MPYLTYEEYENITLSDMDVVEFDKLLPRASGVIDNVTRNFYQFNDLETDNPFRKRKFKSALAFQIEYFHDVGAVTSEGINSPQSVTIGRTSVSSGSRGSVQQQESTNKLVSQDALLFLEGTGLLYRGIGVI
ncbi:hypothetical protein [Bacillus sp. FSL K6-3431]|uniref:hypothetical protein n=1 Tax=Bacillus sp. FSL K6-3431 TaxID=2921500 RepID=UPI0030FA97E5